MMGLAGRPWCGRKGVRGGEEGCKEGGGIVRMYKRREWRE
jgi:hypothetical protein